MTGFEPTGEMRFDLMHATTASPANSHVSSHSHCVHDWPRNVFSSDAVAAPGGASGEVLQLRRSSSV